MHRSDKCRISFRHLYLLSLQKAILSFITSPFQKSAQVHDEEYRAARHDRVTPDVKPEGDPADARHHENEKAEFILVAEQKDRTETARGREPIDTVELEEIHCFTAAIA